MDQNTNVAPARDPKPESADSAAPAPEVTGFAAIDQAAAPLQEPGTEVTHVALVDQANADGPDTKIVDLDADLAGYKAAKENEKKAVFIVNHGPPIDLRIEQKVKGEMGIETFRTVGEIALARGRNEVDAASWDLWYAVDGETNPLITSGIITVEKPKEETDGKDPE